MSSIKPAIFELCKEIAKDFEGWNFVGDVFKNKTHKCADAVISPGFNFYGNPNNSGCSMQPSVCVVHKKSLKLCKKIFGFDRHCTSFIDFQVISNQLQYYPEKMRALGYIWENRQPFAPGSKGQIEPWPESWIGFDEARPVFKALLMDGISLLEQYYDLSSEEALLSNLPPKYQPDVGQNEELEMQKGVMLCIVRICQGDFEFVEHYASDDFKTVRPKRTADIQRIMTVLPDLKRQFIETGSVV